ncbi:MAG: hypothetical protein GX621_16790 [Pirellulaceae bacterium]|nr:hypothetical protein [Pirellulaceae bacterium]
MPRLLRFLLTTLLATHLSMGCCWFDALASGMASERQGGETFAPCASDVGGRWFDEMEPTSEERDDGSTHRCVSAITSSSANPLAAWSLGAGGSIRSLDAAVVLPDCLPEASPVAPFARTPFLRVSGAARLHLLKQVLLV